MLVRYSPPSIYVVGDPDGRLGYTVENLLADPDTTWPCQYIDGLVDDIPAGVHTLVWIGDGNVDAETSWREVAELAWQSIGSVICAEAISGEAGLGIRTLRALDPTLARVVTDEVPDGKGDTRSREAWEEPAHWGIARSASWRFVLGAEDERCAFIAGLNEWDPQTVVERTFALLEKWPHAFDAALLGMVAAAEQGASMQANRLFQRFRKCPGVTSSQSAEAWRMLKAYGIGIADANGARAPVASREERAANSANGRASKLSIN
jgi:hypothetical protein